MPTKSEANACEKCPKCGVKRGVVGWWLGAIYSHEPNEKECLRNQLRRERDKSARLVKALTEIATATPKWTSGCGSYTGGETWCAFASRLQSIATLGATSDE